MKYKIYTLGCKVNIFESESVSKILDNNGYVRVEDEVADIYIINTCTVTNKSDSKSRKVIRSFIRENEDAIVIVMGCYAQVSKDEVLAIDGVDIILGNDEKDNIHNIIQDYLNDNRQLVMVSDIMKSKKMSELATDHFYENTRAFLKIQDGCNNFCSFCIIPYARGLMRSKSKNQVLSEAKQLVDNNYREIVLTGIHTGGYGNDLEDYSFTQLVEDILEIDGLLRLRISSIEINQITPKLIKLLNTNDKLAKHLHIPIQSGSEEILKSMKRKYSLREYVDKVLEIKNNVSNIAITTDLIVGYPTEGEDEFNESIETCIEVGFSELHVFPYSKRNGTPAAKLPQVNDGIKKSRVKEMLELSNKLNIKFYESQIGYVDNIIIEKIDDDFAYGKTGNYLNVKIANNDYELGDVVLVEIDKYENNVCSAILK